MSEKAKHTPGPWEIEPKTTSSEICSIYVTDDEDGYTHVRPVDRLRSISATEQSANARLIAAAPDMAKKIDKLENAIIEAIQSLEELNCRCEPVCDKLKAALAKAEDKPND